MNILTISLAIFAATILWLVTVYNKLINNRQKVKEGWSGIDVQLKRRVDVIPNLIETVKGYVKHEDKVLNEVVALRSNCQKTQNSSVQDRTQAESLLSGALGKLLVTVEGYPDLKANQNFIALQQNLVEIENQIQMARRYYNGSVRDLNIIIESFPNNIIAKNFGFKSEPYFEITNAAEREVVQVKF